MSTPRTTIVVNLPAHRRRALSLVDEGRVAEQAYDRNIGGYIAFLQQQAQAAGFTVHSSQDEQQDAVFRIDERSHDDKKAAHAWLETLPDIWNWMPSA